MKKCIALVSLLLASSIWAGIIGETGSANRWELAPSIEGRPEFELKNKLSVRSVELTLGPEEKVNNKVYQWIQLSFTRDNQDTYKVWLLADGLPDANRHTAADGNIIGRSPQVIHYLFQEPKQNNAVEFIHAVDGATLMPRWDFWSYGYLRTIKNQALTDLNAKEVKFQGFPFLRVANARVKFELPQKIKTLKLNPDLLLGFTFTWRDIEGRYHDLLESKKHNYIQVSETDELADIAAGLNMHSSQVMHDFLWQEPTYISRLFWFPEDWPANLYRANFWGRAIYLDEPAIHQRGKWYAMSAEAAKKITPAEVAQSLEDASIEPLWRKDGNQDYSLLWYNKFIEKNFGRGDLWIVERDVAVWEIMWETAYYQLAARNSTMALVDEDCEPETLVERYNMAFGTQILASIENACAIRTAVGRGAARNFNKKWGVAIYANGAGSLQPKIDMTALRYFYNAGSTYFWFWNGYPPNLMTAHVPYNYKRAYASAVQQAFRENPKRDMKQLRDAASVCLLLPYGYVFSWYNMFGTKHLHLDAVNKYGKTYREILAKVATEIERCIRLGIKFDLAVDDNRFNGDSYKELIYFYENGNIIHKINREEVKIEQVDIATLRPNLGPMPKLELEVTGKTSAPTPAVTVKATPNLQSGVLALDVNGKVLTSWEVVSPDGLSEFVFFENPGLVFTIPTPQKGKYQVRVAICDCFGRPAFNNISFEVK